ncbi:hypothetical protein [Rhodococcus aetherivorans]|uniref:hypothetical protein n=1 Tax=Rhodococcus aetherivorans TaxID=191292 RepID=UPI00388D9EB6
MHTTLPSNPYSRNATSYDESGRLHMPAQHRPLHLQHHRAARAISSVPGQHRRDMIIPTARFHETFKMLKRQMYGHANLDLPESSVNWPPAS